MGPRLSCFFVVNMDLRPALFARRHINVVLVIHDIEMKLAQHVYQTKTVPVSLRHEISQLFPKASAYMPEPRTKTE
jgi:hypothetical protein